VRQAQFPAGHFRPREELGTNPSLFYLTGKGGGKVGGGK
jgi:hypothetical protein